MIRKLAEYMGKDNEKSVIVRKPKMNRSELKVDSADSRLSLPITVKTFPTDGKDVRYVRLVEYHEYIKFKKIMEDEFK